MTMYLGNFPVSGLVDFNWSSNNANGASITRATNGTVSVYKANGTTQSVAGVSDTEDFDGLTGIHHCRIDTSADGTFYAAGSEFSVVLSGAIIDGQTVNAVLGHFSIERAGGALAMLKSATYGLSAIETLVDELETRLSAARAGYLDNLSGGAVALASSLSTLQGLVDDLESRLSAARAGYLDNLSGGAVALASTLATLQTYVDTEVASILAAVDTEIATLISTTNAINTKTTNLPASPAAVGSAMSLAADAVNSTSLAASAVSEIQAGLATTAGIAALNNLSAAQVNAEVVDALTTDTYAEPGSVPAATSSIKDKIGFVFAALRNKHLTTETTDVIRNDADSGAIGTAALNEDGTTFSRGEYA